MLKQNVECKIYFMYASYFFYKIFKVFIFVTATQEIQAIVLRAYKNFVKCPNKGDLEKTDFKMYLNYLYYFDISSYYI